MRRRLLPIAAVALAGLLLGAWLAWPEPLPPTPPPPPRSAAAPVAARPPAIDTGWAEDPAPPPVTQPTPAAVDPHLPSRAVVDRLPSGTVSCRVVGDRVTRFSVMLAPTSDLVDALTASPDLSAGQAIAGLHASLPGRIDGGTLVFQAPLIASTAFVEGEQPGGRTFFSEVSLTWSGEEGRCATPIALTPAFELRLSGRVAGLLEGERAIVQVCDEQRTVSDEAGRWSATAYVPEGSCRVLAWRLDGALRAFSEPVLIEVRSEAELTGIDLQLPPDDIGGMGARIEPAEDGVRLVDVGDDSPGSRAGLRNGETVIAVDGQPLAGLSLEDAIATITGPVGSYAVLTVVDEDGTERDVELRRDWIADD